MVYVPVEPCVNSKTLLVRMRQRVRPYYLNIYCQTSSNRHTHGYRNSADDGTSKRETLAEIVREPILGDHGVYQRWIPRVISSTVQ